MAEAQNFRISVKNFTNIKFLAGEEKMKWGGVYDKSNIKKRTTTTKVFYTRGDKDAATGTEGTLTYKSPDGSASITFTWDIPWGLGEDKLDVTVSGPIKLEEKSWRGAEVLRKIVEIVVLDDAPVAVVKKKSKSNIKNLFSFLRSVSKKRRRRK